MDFTVTDQQKELIEKLGVYFEDSGMQPVTARVQALLLIADHTELTFEEIQNILGISKSSTSGAINMLLTLKRIEYITRPGDRKRYFRSRIRDWQLQFKEKIDGLANIAVIYNEVLEQRNPDTTDFNYSLKELINFLEFFKGEVQGIFERWQEKRES